MSVLGIIERSSPTARSAIPQLSLKVSTPAGEIDVFISNFTDTAEARRSNFRGSAEADEEKTLKGLVIRGLKPDKYYEDRKKLTQ